MVLAPCRHRLIREAILGSQQTRRNGEILIRSIEIGTFHATGFSQLGLMPATATCQPGSRHNSLVLRVAATARTTSPLSRVWAQVAD